MPVLRWLRSLLSSTSMAIGVTLLTTLGVGFVGVFGLAILAIVVAAIAAGGLGFAVIVAAVPLNKLAEIKAEVSKELSDA